MVQLSATKNYSTSNKLCESIYFNEFQIKKKYTPSKQRMSKYIKLVSEKKNYLIKNYSDNKIIDTNIWIDNLEKLCKTMKSLKVADKDKDITATIIGIQHLRGLHIVKVCHDINIQFGLKIFVKNSNVYDVISKWLDNNEKIILKKKLTIFNANLGYHHNFFADITSYLLIYVHLYYI